MKYESYIFDLYGTLVDIRTDEEREELWDKLALFYGYYDAHYTPEELKRRYGELVSGKEAALKERLDGEAALKERSGGGAAGKETALKERSGGGAAGEAAVYKKDDVHESHPEIKIEQVFAALFKEKGVEADETLAVHAGQFFRILSTEYVRLYDGAEKVLKAIRESGKKLYLLSNAQRIFTEYEMHTLGIADYFDDILISSEYSVKKPDIRFFEALIEKHQIDVGRAIMIGNDAKSDIFGAKNAGLFTCYIHSNISPELPLEKKRDKAGKIVEVPVMPEADYVLKEMDMEALLNIL